MSYNQELVPYDIIFQVLLYLPVATLLRCKAVCKQWCAIIADHLFIKQHAKTTKIMHLTYTKSFVVQCRLLDASSVHIPVKIHSCGINTFLADDYIRVGGSCNGLICVVQQGHVSLFNPFTGKSKRLRDGFPMGNQYQVSYGFGHGNDDDYKVVAISKKDNHVKIFSVDSGIWKPFGVFPGDTSMINDAVHVDGKLHWLETLIVFQRMRLETSFRIVRFDVKNESYDVVVLPEFRAGRKYLDLGVLDNLLSIVCTYADIDIAEVWVMRDAWTLTEGE